MYSPVVMRYPIQMTNKKTNKVVKRNANNTGNTSRVAPASRGNVRTRPPPKVAFSANGDVVVTHSEYISDVAVGTTFLSTKYPVNPQDPGTFTWLSAIASRYEVYEFQELKFSYEPSCSTATDGYVILAMDFDAYDDTPSKVTALAWRETVKSAPWERCVVNTKQSLKGAGWRYCNSNATKGDTRVNDLGNLWVLTDQGTGGTKSVGEVFVHYTVTLKQPAYRIPPAVYSSSSIDSSGSAFGWTVPAGNARIVQVPSTHAFTLSTPGEYILTLTQKNGAGFSGTTMTFSSPATSPNSEFSSYFINSLFDTTGEAVLQYALALTSGAVLITNNLSATGGFLKALLTLTTYKYSNTITPF